MVYSDNVMNKISSFGGNSGKLIFRSKFDAYEEMVQFLDSIYRIVSKNEKRLERAF